MRFVPLIIIVVLLGATPAQASCGQVCHLKQQNAALSKQVKKLRAQRDMALAELSQAQSGVTGVIATMAPPQVWNLMREIANIFVTPQYSNSYFSNASDYESWTFTRCGFC